MLLPIMGFFMFFVPAAGMIAGALLLCVKPMRFLAPFAFLMPLFGSYGAIAGFWGAAIMFEHFGLSEGISSIGGLLGLAFGGSVGAGIAFMMAGGVPRLLQVPKRPRKA